MGAAAAAVDAAGPPRRREKTFIDFSGKRPALVDPRTGEVQRVELFVAVLGASGFTYAEATASQQLADWVDAHVRMVEYFGGTTDLWVPDQLKSAITRPCRYEPGVNRTYEDLAPTTAPSSYRHGRGNRGTKLPRRRQYFWPSGGYSPGSATRRSSASAP